MADDVSCAAIPSLLRFLRSCLARPLQGVSHPIGWSPADRDEVCRAQSSPRKNCSGAQSPERLWSFAGNPPTKFPPVKLHGGPVLRRRNWLDWVNQPLSEAELDAMKVCISRGRPYGEELWQKRIVTRLGLESTMRPRGPRRSPKSRMSPLSLLCLEQFPVAGHFLLTIIQTTR